MVQATSVLMHEVILQARTLGKSVSRPTGFLYLVALHYICILSCLCHAMSCLVFCIVLSFRLCFLSSPLACLVVWIYSCDTIIFPLNRLVRICKVCYTEHSLFGLNDAASIHVNKILKFTLSDVDHCIAVSRTCRDNLILRASLEPSKVYTIPNAIDPDRFKPDKSNISPKVFPFLFIFESNYFIVLCMSNEAVSPIHFEPSFSWHNRAASILSLCLGMCIERGSI